MRYISLFSGIGGFEQAIHSVFPNATCLGYSEIKPTAIEVYKRHYPTHTNLGDVKEIDRKKLKSLGKCDLLVAGFPCTNLSSLANIQGDNRGLNGSSSKLFYELTRILKILKSYNPDIQFVIENNASMTKRNQEIITSELNKIKHIYVSKIDAGRFGVQTRKRIYWTTFELSLPIKRIQTWDDVLAPLNKTKPISSNYVDCLNRVIPCKTKTKNRVFYNGKDFEVIEHNDFSRSRWQCSFHSDTTDKKVSTYSYPVGNCRPITASFGNHNVLVDRRGAKPFIVRQFEIEEIEKLFGFPEGYVCLPSRSKAIDCLGNTVVVFVIEYILRHIKNT